MTALFLFFAQTYHKTDTTSTRSPARQKEVAAPPNPQPIVAAASHAHLQVSKEPQTNKNTLRAPKAINSSRQVENLIMIIGACGCEKRVSVECHGDNLVDNVQFEWWNFNGVSFRRLNGYEVSTRQIRGIEGENKTQKGVWADLSTRIG